MSEHPVKLTEIKKEELLILLEKSGSRKAIQDTGSTHLITKASINRRNR